MKVEQNAQQGFLGGSRPFAVNMAEGDLVPNATEQKAIQKLRRLKSQARSLRDIAAVIRADGYDVSHVVVARVLRAPES